MATEYDSYEVFACRRLWEAVLDTLLYDLNNPCGSKDPQEWEADRQRAQRELDDVEFFEELCQNAYWDSDTVRRCIAAGLIEVPKEETKKRRIR